MAHDVTSIRFVSNLLAEWIEQVSGVPADPEDGPQRQINGPKATFKITSLDQVGQDWIRYQLNGTGDKLNPIVQGTRNLILSINFRSDSAYEPFALANKFRTEMFLPDNKAKIYDVGLVVTDILSTVDSSYNYNNRRMKQVTIDVSLSINENTVASTHEIDWVERVSGSGEFTKQDETTVSETFDTDDET